MPKQPALPPSPLPPDRIAQFLLCAAIIILFSGLLALLHYLSGYGQDADFTPPAVAWLKVEPQLIDTTLSHQVITVTLLATDDASGINYVSVFFQPDTGGSQYAGLSYTPLDAPLSLPLTVTVPIKQHSAAGRWGFLHIRVEDVAGNAYLAFPNPYCASNPLVCVNNSSVDGTFYNVYRPKYLHLPLLAQ